MPKLAVNMIVRNEADKIERCLNSVVPYISAAVIVDTGSTDETVRLMEQTFANAKIPYEIFRRPFVNFEQARNEALALARLSKLEFEYILLTDADMELVVEDKLCFADLTGPSYDMIQKGGSLSYHNRRIVNRYASGNYRGATHEYLDIPAAGCISGAYFVDHADGANRKDKFQRDIDLLVADLKEHPDNARSWFYLARSYHDNGQAAQAAQAYRKRVEMGGWEEEVWDAKLNYARCQRALNNDAGFVTGMIDAYNYRSSRAEPLYELARYYREKGDQRASLLFSERGMAIPRTTDALFVVDYAYDVGLKEEFSICAYYDESKRDLGFKVSNDLALDRKGTDYSREQARNNMYWYIKPLSAWAPSFKAHNLGFVPPDDYTPLNPSIALVGDQLHCIIRAVNYTIDKDGRYLIRKLGAEANGENPIDTRNFLCVLGQRNYRVAESEEIVWRRPKPAFDLVTGMEDMRLLYDGHDLFVNACVREENANGWCRQVQARLEGPDVGNWHTMSQGERHEKNWMPWLRNGELQYVYRLGTVVGSSGKTVEEHKPELATENISGSSQVIRFAGDYLAVVHEARYHDGKRFYWHRFALMDDDGALRKLSAPFFLHDKQIEFVAGLCWHPDHQRLLLSYGVRDEEAWVAEVDWQEVAEMFL